MVGEGEWWYWPAMVGRVAGHGGSRAGCSGFLVTLFVDNFCGAFATVAAISFMSYFTSRTYTGTQFALLTAISNFGRTSLAATSGMMVDMLHGDWSIFFVLTMVMVVPSLCLLVWIARLIKERE